MKKAWVLSLGMLVLGAGSLKLWADGSYAQAPGPQISATGQNYYWPAAAANQPGAALVNDGVGTFRWTTTPIGTVNSATSTQFLTLSSMTVVQISASTAAVVGQVVYCGNCTANGGKGTICISTSTAAPGAGSDFVLSTGTLCN